MKVMGDDELSRRQNKKGRAKGQDWKQRSTFNKQM